MDCIFCKIRDKEIPKEFTYEDEDVMVFPDIHPLKPIHLLVIPKKHIRELTELTDPIVLEKLFSVMRQLILDKGLTDKGYRISLNGGGLQDIDHVHFHLMGPISSPIPK